MNQNQIKFGDYLIIQRQGYTKLHKIKPNGTITLGKDVIQLDNIVGHKYYETFRMIVKPGSKRLYTLEEVNELTTKNQLNIEQSGADNRNIIDDGNSQALTKDEIERLRDQAVSSSDIVEKLIANSKTFNSKTEYSQEKYLKKKEKKYFEYIQVRKPSIRLLAQLFYRQDPAKTLGIRIDDLSQILTYANIQSDGKFLLYDSGTSGLVTSAIMNSIGPNTHGQLIHAHPGNECQKAAFLAMQFPQEQVDRCIHVNLYSVLRCYYQEGGNYVKGNESDKKQNQEKSGDNSQNVNQKSHSEDNAKCSGSNSESTHEANQDSQNDEITKQSNINSRKRKHSESDSNETGTVVKRPYWQLENEKACHILQEKVDSIIVVAKEHPMSIVKELLPFLKDGRTLVVFNLVKEPLQDLYFYLKNRTDFIGVKLSNNFMRNYQVLPERTHPEVIMNFGGYILSGYKLNM
ncbi:hypothetical protein ILUMI_09385 [Ignelater luminosus]|uniref:tRNA (adenine(58)-N(1))-methyltransferase non-catalytic subunit TRM6 n=1 Tax=Ignelater luminosus TaxID=2038154 RepID=A0A8K0G9Q0_IGNLU|nr:hypothetical protein ILUMI_09385 [Ignelater luminosus]